MGLDSGTGTWSAGIVWRPYLGETDEGSRACRPGETRCEIIALAAPGRKPARAWSPIAAGDGSGAPFKCSIKSSLHFVANSPCRMSRMSGPKVREQVVAED